MSGRKSLLLDPGKYLGKNGFVISGNITPMMPVSLFVRLRATALGWN